MSAARRRDALLAQMQLSALCASISAALSEKGKDQVKKLGDSLAKQASYG